MSVDDEGSGRGKKASKCGICKFGAECDEDSEDTLLVLHTCTFISPRLPTQTEHFSSQRRTVGVDVCATEVQLNKGLQTQRNTFKLSDATVDPRTLTTDFVQKMNNNNILT